MAIDVAENVHDPAVSFTRREYFTAHMPVLTPPASFKHTPPPDKPEIPDTGILSAPELAEVEAWLADANNDPALPDAVTWVEDFLAYKTALASWRFSNQIARATQYRIAFGDGLIYNRATLALSSDVTGAGDDPPPPTLTPRNDP